MTKAIFRKLHEMTDIRGGGRIIALLAVLASASCAFAADWTVTADTSLEEDTTVDALVVSPGATLDLNGYSLTAKSIGTGDADLINGQYKLCNSVTAASAGPYILTDYTLQATDRVVARIQYPATPGSAQMLFGARTLIGSTTSSAFTFVLSGTARRFIVYYDGNTSGSSFTQSNAIEPLKDYIITIDGKAKKYSTEYASTSSGSYEAKNKSWTTATTTDFTNNGTHEPFAIFGCNQYNGTTATVSSKSKCTVYWLKVYDNNGNLVRCFVPAKDTQDDDKAGLYETKTKTFYKPPTGSLTAAGDSVSADLNETIDVGGGDSCITNSSETVATLTVNVDDGETENTAVGITGNLKLVKWGAGTFVASCTNQTYSGGTEINDGMLKCGVAGGSSPFGTGGVTVGAGGTLDMNGKTGYNETLITMDGGTLVNSGSGVNYNNLALGNVRLTANSTFALSNNYAIAANDGSSYGETFLDLGGHTLDVSLSGSGNLYLSNCFMTNGAINVASDDNRLITFFGAPSRAVNVDLTVGDGIRFYPNVETSVSGIRDFTLNGGCYDYAAATGTVEVVGTFKCTTNIFCNVKLMNGATFDLSDETGSFNVESGATAARKRYVSFENGGTINVEIGDREVNIDDKLIEWTTQPEGCTFNLLSNGVVHADYKVAPTASGLDVVSAAEGQPELDGVNTTIELNGTTATVNWTLTSAGGNAADVFVVSTDQSGAVVTNDTAEAQATGATGSAMIENLYATGGFSIEVIAQCGLFTDSVSSNFTAIGTASVPAVTAIAFDGQSKQITVSGTVSSGTGTTSAWVDFGSTASYGGKNALTLVDGDWTTTIPYTDALLKSGRVYVCVTASNEVTGVFGPVAWKRSVSTNESFTVEKRTIAATAFDRDSGEVTLAFGGDAIAAQDIVVVWDTKDNGENIDAWPYNKRAIIGSVNAGAATASFPLPAEVLVSGTYYRFFLGVGAAALYDEEVTWIQPAQLGASIRTEFKPSTQPRFEMKISLDGNQVTSEKDYGHIVHTGTEYLGDVWLFCDTSGHIGAKRFGHGYFGPFSTTAALTLVGDWRNQSQTTALKVNNTTCDANPFHNNLTKSPSNYARFWGGYNSVGDGKTFGFSTYRLYYSKWWNSGKTSLEAHFIPVKKGDEYMLYDIVNKKLAKNYDKSGSTSFTGGGKVTDTYKAFNFATEMAVTPVRMMGTIEITERDWARPNEEVSLRWPKLGDAAKLWVAYSTSPVKSAPGEFADPSAWDACVSVTNNVTSGTTNGTYTLEDPLPSGYKSMRFILSTSGSTADKLDVILVSPVYPAQPKPVLFMVY